MTADPYPQELEPIVEGVVYATPSTPDPLIVALNRIAIAIEANTRALQGPQAAPARPQATLAALPPVQGVSVQPRPACPFHGVDKVAPSKQGPGFYCQAKAAPGQPQNARGYCTWHS